MPRGVAESDPAARLVQRDPAVRKRDARARAASSGERNECSIPSAASAGRRRVLGPRRDLDQAVQLEKPRAALLLELGPAVARLGREPHPLRLGIREPDDPRAAVARAARVVRLELLVDDDVGAAARELPRGRRAHDPRADDRDFHAAMRSPG